MDPKTYHCPAGFTIVSAVVECVHCKELMDSSETWTHREGHAMERAAEKNQAERNRRDVRRLY